MYSWALSGLHRIVQLVDGKKKYFFIIELSFRSEEVPGDTCVTMAGILQVKVRFSVTTNPTQLLKVF